MTTSLPNHWETPESHFLTLLMKISFRLSDAELENVLKYWNLPHPGRQPGQLSVPPANGWFSCLWEEKFEDEKLFLWDQLNILIEVLTVPLKRRDLVDELILPFCTRFGIHPQ